MERPGGMGTWPREKARAPSAPGTKCRLKNIYVGTLVDSCFSVPLPSLHPGGQVRPRDEGLGSRERCLPGSPCSPLRPGLPGRPGGPAAPSLPSGARHTFWVTVEARDMASTPTTSQPHGASMMPLWRHDRAWAGWTSHTRVHPTHTLESRPHNDIYTSSHHQGTPPFFRDFDVYPPSGSREHTRVYIQKHKHRHTHMQLSIPLVIHPDTLITSQPHAQGQTN